MTNFQNALAVEGHAKKDLAWYLAQCKPNAERVALKNLENQNFNAFMPLQKVTRRKAQTFQSPSRPLFSGYIFVEIDFAKGDWQKINSTRGVARLVRFGAFPCPVPQFVMQSLFASCDQANIFQQGDMLEAGDRVRVTQGPLSGFAAKIADTGAERRVHLLLEIMGQTSAVKIHRDYLLKLT